MTVSSTLNRSTLLGNGVTTTQPISFPFQSASDLVVLLVVIATGVQTTKTITTHYTVTGTPDALGHYSNGGAVEWITPPSTLEMGVVYRDPARTQSLDLVENDNLPANNLEAAIDRQTMLIQRVADLIGRSLRQPDGDSAAISTMPSKVARALLVLGFDADGNPIAVAVTGAVGTALPITGGTLTGNLTITTPSIPALKLNTTHASNFAAQLQFLVSGTSKFIIANDFNQAGSNDLTIYDAVAAADRLIITSAGVVSLPIGQLKFPPTANPSANANTLDDYEEGSWTPAVGGTATYTLQEGTYTKIGRQVTLRCRLIINVIGTGSPINITGVPFSPMTGSRMSTGAVVWASAANTLVACVANLQDSTTTISLHAITAANATLAASVGVLGNGASVGFSLTYEI